MVRREFFLQGQGDIFPPKPSSAQTGGPPDPPKEWAWSFSHAPSRGRVFRVGPFKNPNTGAVRSAAFQPDHQARGLRNVFRDPRRHQAPALTLLDKGRVPPQLIKAGYTDSGADPDPGLLRDSEVPADEPRCFVEIERCKSK